MAAANLKIAAADDLEAMLLEEARMLREKTLATGTVDSAVDATAGAFAAQKAARQSIGKAAPSSMADLADGLFDTLKGYIDKQFAKRSEEFYQDSLKHTHGQHPASIRAIEAIIEHQRKLLREHEILEQRLSILESRR